MALDISITDDCATMYVFEEWGGGRGLSHGLHVVYAWTSGLECEMIRGSGEFEGRKRVRSLYPEYV